MEARAARRLLFCISFPACSIQIDEMCLLPLTRDTDPGTRGIGGCNLSPLGLHPNYLEWVDRVVRSEDSSRPPCGREFALNEPDDRRWTRAIVPAFAYQEGDRRCRHPAVRVSRSANPNGLA